MIMQYPLNHMMIINARGKVGCQLYTKMYFFKPVLVVLTACAMQFFAAAFENSTLLWDLRHTR